MHSCCVREASRPQAVQWPIYAAHARKAQARCFCFNHFTSALLRPSFMRHLTLELVREES